MSGIASAPSVGSSRRATEASARPASGSHPGSPPVPSLVVLGDLVLDIAVSVREPLDPGSDAAASVRFYQGGSAANTARMAARLGGRASFVGAVGRDAWGRLLVRVLRDARVEVHAPPVAGMTARIVVLVAPDGERTFATERGAADGLLPAHLHPAWFRRDGLHLPGYSLFSVTLRDAALAACRLAREAGAAVSVDLASRRPLLARGRRAALRDLRAVAPDLLFANSDEAEALTSGGRPEALLEVAAVVALKQGRSGCVVLARSRPGSVALAVGTRPVEARDTTGAGDAFDAGFLLSWLAAPPEARRDPRVLRTAALAGHRAAHRHLGAHRRELGP